MLANLLQTSFQLVDSLWVGNLLGGQALGAVTISSVLIFTILSFVLGLNNASLTILSQQKGRSDDEGLKRYLNAFVVILTVMAVTLGIVGYFASGVLLQLLNTPESMLADAKIYLQVNFIGMLFLFGYNFISTVLRALGDSKTPLRFVLIAVVLNAVLDPVFIAVFNWGIVGAALATIVAQGVAFIYGLFYVLYRKAAPFTIPTLPSFEEVRLILHLGIPSGLQMSVISAGSAAIMSVVNQFHDSVVAGFSAAQRIDSILMLPAHALGTAVSSMAGQNIGKGNWQRVSAIAKYGVIYNFAIMAFIAMLIIFFGQYGMRMFIQEPEAVAFGASYLKIVAFCLPFLGINFILNGVVRASGAMYQVLVLNIISFWVLRYPFTAIFSKFFGEIGIGIGMGLSFLISSLCAILYYHYGNWRKKQLFKEQAQT